jgi:RND family efflux transporter MFP subunit
MHVVALLFAGLRRIVRLYLEPLRPAGPWGAPALAAGASLFLAACGGAAPPPPPPPEVTVAAAAAREITDWDEFSGRFEAVEAVEVRPRVSGYVQRVAFTEGSDVRRGQVLFEIDPRPYAAELERALAELERQRTRRGLAGSEVARAERLLAVQAISREEFDTRTSARTQGDAEVRAAQAAVTAARLNLEWTRVRAPIDGRVGRAEITEGNLVQAAGGAPLTTVVSKSPIYVYFEGDEQAYLKVAGLGRSGGTVFVGLANEEGFPHEAKLDFVDNRLDPASGTIRARAVLDNPGGRFTPGLYARVRLAGSSRYTATLVRDAAIGTDQDRKFVLVLKPDGTVEYRAVELGHLVDGLRVVRSGLKPGERIVVNGLQRVRPGGKVAAKEEPMVADAALAARTR